MQSKGSKTAFARTRPPSRVTSKPANGRQEAGANIGELCRRHEIKESYYRWKVKYGGLEVNEARRLRQLEEENRRLKHLVADLTLDKETLQG